ncbi:MAG: peptide chain release factor aRF-1 [Candidatus Helarchaeota archaeon]
MSDKIPKGSFEKYKLRRIVKLLKSKKGYHTELTSLYVPPDRPISDITNYLKREAGEAANIKSKTTRKIVQESITKLISQLITFGRTPPETGIALFNGAIPQNGPGSEKMELYVIVPPEPITSFQYRCASEFYVEPLENMLAPKDLYGLIVIDRSGMTMATISGNRKKIIESMGANIPGKHHAGGQSQRRYARLIEQAAHEFYVRAGEHINKEFLNRDLNGIIIGGAGPTKEYFAKSDYLDYRLKEKILAIIDIGYSDEQGINDLIKKSQDVLQNVQIMKEKQVIQKFLSHLARDTGLVTYGEKEVRRALNIGAVDTLLLSEKVDILRVTAKCSNCNYTEEKTIKNEDLEAFKKLVSNKTCPKCNSSQMYLNHTVDLIEELGDIASASGANVEVVSADSEEGAQFWSAFKGVGAILRYKFDQN